MQEINKIKGYRVMIGLTQKEMAEQLNINERTYNYKETNNSKFTVEELNKLQNIFNAHGLKITTSDLV